ncbi:zinc-binding dehydrogenase [Streptomyces sp. NBC_01803]|nr:zinc-binding dehydrogenase [Streptomyces sp. NBC_01803]WSA45387.1 zinc-binding dehydrogenase [Streptomyces sp. NBC_01803]
MIPAAAGGVGSLAVQLAQQAGAEVIALAGTEEKRQLACDLGADAVTDS